MRDDESEYVTEDESVMSDEADELVPFAPEDETFGDRLYALRDMVPPTKRAAISEAFGTTSTWVSWGVKKAGNAAWIVTTSALLVALPLMLTIESEGALVRPLLPLTKRSC